MLADIVRHGLSAWWAPALAFAAGVISFASPCVYPLVPGYVSFVSGAQREDERPVVPILLFILGFAVVFTLLGATAGHLRTWILSTTGQRVAGGVIVAFGLFMLLYAFRLGWVGLYTERRPLLSRVRPGPAGGRPPLGGRRAAGGRGARARPRPG